MRAAERFLDHPIDHPETVLLWINGGDVGTPPDPGSAALGFMAAQNFTME